MKAKASRQKAAKKIYVPQVMTASMSGVTSPIMKLHIQVVDVVMEIALERMDKG